MDSLRRTNQSHSENTLFTSRFTRPHERVAKSLPRVESWTRLVESNRAGAEWLWRRRVLVWLCASARFTKMLNPTNPVLFAIYVATTLGSLKFTSFHSRRPSPFVSSLPNKQSIVSSAGGSVPISFAVPLIYFLKSAFVPFPSLSKSECALSSSFALHLSSPNLSAVSVKYQKTKR